MTLPNNIFDLIDDIIERAYLDFTYQLLGKDFLTTEQKIQVEALGLLVSNRPLLELVYLLVRQRSEERYQTDSTLQELLSGIFATGVLGGLTDLARANLDNSLHAMDTVIERSKAEVKASVKFEISRYNKSKQLEQRANGQTLALPVPATDEEVESSSAPLVLAIAAALLLTRKNFERDFTSELTTLVNQAATDIAIDTYGVGSVADGEVYCYKKVTLDDRTSDHCKKYYLNRDGSPKIYKLSELIANGVNDPRDKKSWKPTVPCDHPRCFTEAKTPVLTSKGWKAISEIQIGESVLTHTGKFKKVVGTINEKYSGKPAMQITYEMGGRNFNLRVTPDHEFLVDGQWVEAQDLMPGQNLTKLEFPCVICSKAVSLQDTHGFKLNKTCSESCNQEFRAWVIADWHSEMSQAEKDSRAANCSAGIQQAIANGHRTLFQDPGYHTEEVRRQASERISSRMDQMLSKSASTRVSRHQRYVFNWVQDKYPNKTVELEHRVGNYFVDVALIEDKIAIEMDGHYHIGREDSDAKRDRFLESLGWTVIRFGLGGTAPKPAATKSNVLYTIDLIMNNHRGLFDFSEARIISVKSTITNHKTRIYCLTVEDDESFIARGVVSHNCRSQLIILGKNSKN